MKTENFLISCCSLLLGMLIVLLGRIFFDKKRQTFFTLANAEGIGIGILTLLLLIITVVYS